MTIQSFIDKAIQSGWGNRRVWGFEKDWRGDYIVMMDGHGQHIKPKLFEEVLLDPEAWKAVGKSKERVHATGCYTYTRGKCDCMPKDWYDWAMHSLIDTLISGESIEVFLATL